MAPCAAPRRCPRPSHKQPGQPFFAAASLLPGRLRVLLKRAGAGVVERDVVLTRFRANTPRRLAALLARAGFAEVTVGYAATLHRYAERKPRLARLIRALERRFPPRFRSTIVAWYRPA